MKAHFTNVWKYALLRFDGEKLNNFIAGKISSGLSTKYVRDISGVIRSACKYTAKRFGCADRTEFVTLPKCEKKEKKILKKSEQTALKQYLLSDVMPTNTGILLAIIGSIAK